MSDNNNSGRGVSALFLLGLVFLVLKLTGYISWSWWLVCLPFYFPIVWVVVWFGVFALIAAGTAIIAGIVAGIMKLIK